MSRPRLFYSFCNSKSKPTKMTTLLCHSPIGVGWLLPLATDQSWFRETYHEYFNEWIGPVPDPSLMILIMYSIGAPPANNERSNCKEIFILQNHILPAQNFESSINWIASVSQLIQLFYFLVKFSAKRERGHCQHPLAWPKMRRIRTSAFLKLVLATNLSFNEFKLVDLIDTDCGSVVNYSPPIQDIHSSKISLKNLLCRKSEEARKGIFLKSQTTAAIGRYRDQPKKATE